MASKRALTAYPLVSIFIFAVLAAQIVSGFRRTYQWWPFLSYPMYASSHFDQERIDVSYIIYAVTPDGTRHYLDPDMDLGIGFWRYGRLARQLGVNHLKSNAHSLEEIGSRYPNLLRVEVEDYPMMITRDGPKAAPRLVTNIIPRDAIDEAVK